MKQLILYTVALFFTASCEETSPINSPLSAGSEAWEYDGSPTAIADSAPHTVTSPVGIYPLESLRVSQIGQVEVAVLGPPIIPLVRFEPPQISGQLELTRSAEFIVSFSTPSESLIVTLTDSLKDSIFVAKTLTFLRDGMKGKYVVSTTTNYNELTNRTSVSSSTEFSPSPNSHRIPSHDWPNIPHLSVSMTFSKTKIQQESSP